MTETEVESHRVFYSNKFKFGIETTQEKVKPEKGKGAIWVLCIEINDEQVCSFSN